MKFHTAVAIIAGILFGIITSVLKEFGTEHFVGYCIGAGIMLTAKVFEDV